MMRWQSSGQSCINPSMGRFLLFAVFSKFNTGACAPRNSFRAAAVLEGARPAHREGVARAALKSQSAATSHW
jgi:hypothetical protein